MLLLARSPLSVGFGRSSSCLKAEEEPTASETQSAQSSLRSLVPKLAKRLPVFLEALILGRRLWGQVQRLYPGLSPLVQCGVSLLWGGWDTQGEVHG